MSSPAQHPAHAAPDPRRWLALFILLIANFMNLIDVTIVNVALPSMREGLGATDSQIEWVIAAYVLAFALGLLPFGRLGDIVGRTHMFLWGVAGFTAASALCGLSPNIEFLIIARVIQGLAGAMMTPQVLAIATVTFPPHERGQAFSLFGLSAGLAAVCGPILGGVLISAQLFGMDWQPIFLVNIPVGIAAVIAGYFLIPRLPGHSALKNDFVGIVLFGLGLVCVVFPIIEGRAYGWPLWAFAMIASGFVLLVAFVLWTRARAKAGLPQLLKFDLIANRDFMFGAFVITVFASGIPGMFMVISIFLQSGFGFTPLESGLTNTPFSVGVLVASLIAGRFGSHYLRGRLAASGALLAGGIGALQAFQQVGGALGVALVGEMFFGSLATGFAAGNAPHAVFTDAASFALWYQVASFLLVLLLVPFFKSGGGQGHGQGAPARHVPIEV